MKKKLESESAVDPAAPCWADLSTAQRNNIVRNLIGGDVIKRPYMARDGKITIEIEEHHLRYSDTPGGGWMVIEAIRKAGYAIQIGHDASNWIVSTGRNGEPVGMSAPTMEEAACMLALLILPNTEASHDEGRERL